MPVAALLCPQFFGGTSESATSSWVSMPVAALLCPQFNGADAWKKFYHGFNAGCGIAMPAMARKGRFIMMNHLFQCRLRHCYARNTSGAAEGRYASLRFNAGCGIAMPAMRLWDNKLIDLFGGFQCRLRHCYARNVDLHEHNKSIVDVVSMPVAALLCPQFGKPETYPEPLKGFQCRLRHCYARNFLSRPVRQ